MKLRVAATVWLVAVVCTGLLSAGEHTRDSLDTVKQNLAARKAVLVDVREQKEWDKGHLTAAQKLSLGELKQTIGNPARQAELAKWLSKDRVVYCHCAKGVHALTAGEILEKMGYDVRPLAAGYDELRAAGFADAQPSAPGSKQ